ncbi:MAG: hypothetical protein J5922_05665 [Clostridia bacterium]|nr:hypothetical protein [Clostridia bacterium]
MSKYDMCESCLYFDYDEESDSDVCTIDLDQDDMTEFLNKNTSSCPYYKYYDEYTSVRRQN